MGSAIDEGLMGCQNESNPEEIQRNTIWVLPFCLFKGHAAIWTI